MTTVQVEFTPSELIGLTALLGLVDMPMSTPDDDVNIIRYLLSVRMAGGEELDNLLFRLRPISEALSGGLPAGTFEGLHPQQLDATHDDHSKE